MVRVHRIQSMIRGQAHDLRLISPWRDSSDGRTAHYDEIIISPRGKVRAENWEYDYRTTQHALMDETSVYQLSNELVRFLVSLYGHAFYGMLREAVKHEKGARYF